MTTNLNFLHEKWRSIHSIKHSETTDEIFKELIDRYQEPHRAYHNLTHIEDLILLNEAVMNNEDPNFCIYKYNKDDLSDDLLFFFFHDSIYYTINPYQNEWLSYQEYKRLRRPIYKGRNWLDTAHAIKLSHHKTQLGSWNCYKRVNYLLDCDLTILGSPRNQYIQYKNNIRLEYKTVSDKKYYTNRLKFLNKMYARMTVNNASLNRHAPLDNFPMIKKQAISNIEWEIGEIQNLSL